MTTKNLIDETRALHRECQEAIDRMIEATQRIEARTQRMRDEIAARTKGTTP